jgi:hypothetical protein
VLQKSANISNNKNTAILEVILEDFALLAVLTD